MPAGILLAILVVAVLAALAPRGPAEALDGASADAAMLNASILLPDRERVKSLLQDQQGKLEPAFDHLYRPPESFLPANLLLTPESVETMVVVDLGISRLYLFENRDDGPALVTDYYVSQGKKGGGKRHEGDSKTPVGIYFAERFIPGRMLPDLYGEGAFPVNYPNAWDRFKNRSGSGIWIHGNPPKNADRAPLSSEGCVTLNNLDFLNVQDHLDLGTTPVIFADEVRWVREDILDAERAAFIELIDTWRWDWESIDTEAYLSHYWPDFHSGGMDFNAWARHKHRVNAGKTSIEVELRDIALFRYPGEEELLLASFEQSYRSNNFSLSTAKHQYWHRRNGQWKIAYEGKP